jgi:hemoglobin
MAEARAILEPMLPSGPTDAAHPWGDTATPYEEIGGADEVRHLADVFYDVIEELSPTLRAMLPASTRNTRRKFTMYLSGWLGGPPLYEETWGHPRLRMRHMPFPIGGDEAEEWMRCMRIAMTRVEMPEPLRTFLDERFGQLALHMRNQAD